MTLHNIPAFFKFFSNLCLYDMSPTYHLHTSNFGFQDPKKKKLLCLIYIDFLEFLANKFDISSTFIQFFKKIVFTTHSLVTHKVIIYPPDFLPC